MESITVKLKKSGDTALPRYATSGASGMDLRASESLVIRAGEYACVGTGLYLELPEGFEAQVRPRSGLALKHGVTVLNSPGTIDSDYRGEVRVILVNHGKNDFVVEIGDRIAQMVFAAVVRAEIAETDDLGGTDRSSGGFGSTGRK